MILKSLSLRSFRNLQAENLSFSNKINLIQGGNGQGKTNLLEAIHVLSLSKSFRTQQPRELIRLGEDTFSVSGEVSSGSLERRLHVDQDQRTKRLYVNGGRCDVFEYVGTFSTIAFSQSHIEQFKSEPAYRRRMIDRGLCLLQPSHLRYVSDYVRVLKQKNSLLRQIRSVYNHASHELLDAWNSQLAELGARIINSRQSYIQKVGEKLEGRDNFSTSETLLVRYLLSSPLPPNSGLTDTKEFLLKKLNDQRDREIRLGRTLVGPHRDDIEVLINGLSMRLFGSAGQQRSSILAYSLAQMEVYYDVHREYPVCLIDDVDSELDEDRINRCLQVLQSKAQLFLTTTKPKLVQTHSSVPDIRRFSVEEGKVESCVRV
ncbi:MAG: DNA replication/repair protein RecF [Acidobacteriota bacterium]